jgi:hypothetical protein
MMTPGSDSLDLFICVHPCPSVAHSPFSLSFFRVFRVFRGPNFCLRPQAALVLSWFSLWGFGQGRAVCRVSAG